MNDGERTGSIGEGLPVYMDLLSHDILNLNQTVLSYIELMAASPDLDSKSKEHAKRATSQIRISTQIVESMNTLCLLQETEDIPETTSDLGEQVEAATSALEQLMPHRKVRFTRDCEGKAPVVDSGNLIAQAVLNALMNTVQLDHSDAPEIEVHVGRTSDGSEGSWQVTVRDANMALPPGIDLDDIVSKRDDARSKTVKLAGVLLSKMMVERLGGAFEIESPGDRGGVLRMTFKEAGTA